MRAIFSLLWLGGCVPCIASSVENAEATVLMLPSLISGSLSPLVIAVDGKKIISSKDRYSGLELNGAKLKITRGKAVTFHAQTNEDVLHFMAVTAKGARKELPAIELPKLERVALDGTEVVLSIAASAQEVTFDGVPVVLKGGMGRVEVPEDASWFVSLHSIQVKSRGAIPDRSFNVQFSPNTAKLYQASRATASAATSTSSEWLRFQAGAVAAIYRSSAYSVSGDVSWVPSLFFFEEIELSGLFGMTSLKKSTSGQFLRLEYGLFAETVLGGLLIGAGGGGQTWIDHGGTAPMLSGLLGYKPGFVDALTLGYSAVFGDIMIHQIKAGVRFTL